MESPYVVVRGATPVDLFKILMDAVFPNVDVKTLVNGKILQVAEDKLLGVILGFIVFDNGELKRTGYGHITSLFVNRIFRRKGHATRLVTNAEMDLDNQGAAYVSVSVQTTDTDALLFFKKMGYEQEEAVTSNNIDGNNDANVIMMKKLKGKQFYSAEAEGSAPNKPHKVTAACLDGEEEENANVTSKMLKKQQMHPVETEGSAPNEPHAGKAAYLDGEQEDANVMSKITKEQQMHPVETEGKRQAEEEVKAVTSKKQMADEVAAKQKALKTIYVGNLSFKVQEHDIYSLFQEQKVIGVCLGYGKKKKPYAHVEFVTEEEAELALQNNGKELLGRAVKLQKARKWRPYPLVINSNSTAESGGGGLVRGSEKSHGEDENPEAEAVSSKIGSAPEKKADIHFASSSEESSDEDEVLDILKSIA